jgi:L-rhamnose mutarotase
MTLNEFYDRLNNDKSFELYDLWNSNNFEGFVVQLDDGEMIKVKTKWYFENHGLFDLNSIKKYEQIIKIILDERLDEIDYDIVECNKVIFEKINNYIIYHFNEFRNEIFKFLELKQKVNDIREIVNDIKQSKFNYYIFKCLNSKIPCDESRVWELFKENFFRMVKNGIIPMFEE